MDETVAVLLIIGERLLALVVERNRICSSSVSGIPYLFARVQAAEQGDRVGSPDLPAGEYEIIAEIDGRRSPTGLFILVG